MRNIKKQKDGNYYEKIVTWKVKPNYSYRFFSIVGLVLMAFLVIYFTGFQIHYEDSIYKDDVKQNIGFGLASAILSTFGMLAPLVLLFWLMDQSFGEGRKVKFRKLGK